MPVARKARVHKCIEKVKVQHRKPTKFNKAVADNYVKPHKTGNKKRDALNRQAAFVNAVKDAQSAMK